MPLYEYECRGCHQRFELLVRPPETPACPGCHSADLERLLSSFGVSSDATRQSNLQRARKAGSKIRQEKAHAEREEAEHHHH